MLGTTASRVRTLAATTIAAAALVGATSTGAGAAWPDDGVIKTVVLSPGQSDCVSQPASDQVRGDGSATNGGAKFKLVYYSSVLENSPFRASAWAAERRTAYGNFPGPGQYAVCATNTGNTRTIVTIQIRSDGQFS